MGTALNSRPHSLGKRHAVAVRHVDVADDQSNLVSKFLDDPKAVGTVSSLDGLEILPLQNGADELPNGRLVIKDKRDASHASLDGESVREGSERLPIRKILLRPSAKEISRSKPALNDDGFREWLAQRGLDPLPESSSDRITFLASLYDEVTSRLKPTVSEASGAVESIALPAAWSLNLSPKCRCRKALPWL